MRHLLWKEWHEQSWKLAFGCVVLGAMAMIGMRARIVADERMVQTICFLGMTLLPVLASTGLVPAERSEGSFESLLALPVAPWRILLAKTLIGVILCAGPLAVAAGMSLLIAGGREVPVEGTLLLYGGSILAAASLLIWMMVLTIRLPNETRAGLLSLGILICWLLIEVWMTSSDDPGIPRWLLGLCPFAAVHVNQHVDLPLSVALIEQLAVAAPLWFWASGRLNSFSEAPE
jgi:ABC-type transport system involved in multi-copper enzyme maturation permease subunit